MDRLGLPRRGPSAWLTAAFVAGAAAGLLGGLFALRGRTSAATVDPRALRDRIGGLPGGDGVGIRVMGEGIVELVGDAPSADAARVLLDEVRDAPGVEVVVNRLWTPTSREGALD